MNFVCQSSTISNHDIMLSSPNLYKFNLSVDFLDIWNSKEHRKALDNVSEMLNLKVLVCFKGNNYLVYFEIYMSCDCARE